MSSKSRIRAFICASVAPVVLGAISLATPAGAADETFSVTAVVAPPANQVFQSFDISDVDPLLGLYALGDRTNATVDVVETSSNTVILQLNKGNFAGPNASNDFAGPNGVLFVRHREVWAGDAPCNHCTPVTIHSTVKVVDLFSQTLTHTIDTGGLKRADEMCWDPRDHRVMVANNADDPPFASIISTDDYTVKAKIPFDGTNGAPNSNNGAEQCQWDHRTGMFYISVPGIAGQPANQGGIAVINPTTGKVVNTFILPVAQCDTPQGMSVGPDHQILIGCNGSTSAQKSSVVIDDRNGRIIATVPNESGPDEVWFNEGDGHYFLARSAATNPAGTQVLGVIDSDSPGEQSGGTIHRDADAFTGPLPGQGAHSVAADAVTNQVYVPIPSSLHSTVCGAAATTGCIAVFTANGTDRRDGDDRVAGGDDQH